MTTRQPLIIGPFIGGLNTFDDQSSIKDNECAQALNFDLGTDGSLRSRPPFTDTGTSLPLGATGTPRLLGYFYASGGDPYLIASDGLTTTYQYHAGAWTAITATFAATDMVQFDGKAWLVAPVGSANPGGSWTPAGGFLADVDMPKGESITAYKSRLFIAAGKAGTNPTRVYYSKILGLADFWKLPGSVDVGSGDGQAVVKIVTYFDSILVFRTDSIWEYQYGTDPATAISIIAVPSVGLTNRFCLVTYESSLFFMYDQNMYEMANNRANKINTKLVFETANTGSSTEPYSVSLFNDRVVCSFYENIYVLSLRTRAWTQWRSNVWGAIGQIVTPVSESAVREGYALTTGPNTSVPRVSPFLHIQEKLGTVAEPMECVLQTKNYSFSEPGAFKVMFWWGIDAIFRGTVKGYATPIAYSQAVTWGQLLLSTWGVLGTWARPAAPDPSVETQVSSTGVGSVRKFVKFLKKLRFRQISFKIVFDTDGTASSAPIMLFTISAYMSKKQTVTDQIS